MQSVKSAVLLCVVMTLVMPDSWARSEPRVGPSGNSRDFAPLPPPPPTGGVSAAGVDVPLGGTREPVVVINPRNSSNVAMSSLFQSRVSIDGGVNWTLPLNNVVPGGYGRDGDPTMAFNGAGRWFYGYQGRIGSGADEFVSEMDPLTGTLISGPVKVSVSGVTGAYNDKPWLAADRWSGSPFVDRLYLVWTEFPNAGAERVLTAFSTDSGVSWSTPQVLSSPVEGFAWPPHIALAPNGDVYISYHSQPGFICNPDGTSGGVYVLRSTDGGMTYPQKTLAYLPGEADLTYNIQDCFQGVIPGAAFWLQGSLQAWVLPDPHMPGQVYVVSNDDPDNDHDVGDSADVFIVRSLDHGLNWSTPSRVDDGPGTTFQVMPAAAIDDNTGCIVVTWYDNRGGMVNGSGNYLLDVYYTVSTDRGLTFGPDVKLNDVSFDPDFGAGVRFPGPPPTLRIGEYIGTAFSAGTMHAVWTGNSGSGHQIVTDSAIDLCDPKPRQPQSDPGGLRKNRSLRLTVPATVAAGPPEMTALRVRMVALQNPQPPNAPCCPSPDFSAFEAGGSCTDPNGCVRWVGLPGNFFESQDNPGQGSFRAARLQCTPQYLDWVAQGAFDLVGGDVAPSSKYQVENVSSLCAGMEETCTVVSLPLTVMTARSGDVVAPFNPPAASTQPDGLDVSALVTKFKGLPGAPNKSIAQLQPNLPDLNADVGALDIVACVDAFKGMAYAFSGPCPCPSLEVCNSLPCSSAAQCSGGTCVKVCIDGDNDGRECNNNNHCPNGACGSGFCRDACGRCTP